MVLQAHIKLHIISFFSKESPKSFKSYSLCLTYLTNSLSSSSKCIYYYFFDIFSILSSSSINTKAEEDTIDSINLSLNNGITS